MKLNNLKSKVAVALGCLSLLWGAWAKDVVRAREFSSYLTNDSTSPDLVFEGISLKELTDGTYLLGGSLSGDWEPERPASFSTCVLPELSDSVTSMEVQFQYKAYADHAPIIKWVDVVFTQDGDQVKAYQKNQGYVRDRALFGTKITTGGQNWISGSQTTYRITRLGAGVQYSEVSGNVVWTSLPAGVIDEDIILLSEGDTFAASGFKFQNPVIGAGKIIVDRVPGGALKNSTSWHEWTGTLTLKEIDLGLFDPGDYGHMGSKVEVVSCSGYFPKSGDGNTELVITEKMTINAGYTGQSYTVARLSGEGTIDVDTTLATVTFTDSSSFTGSITGSGASNIKKDTKAILVVNEGETVSVGTSVEKVLTVYGNGGTIISEANIWADKNAITSLILQHDSTIGGTFALGLSATGMGATTADLAGYTLAIAKTGNFNLCNATISNGGAIDVVSGNFLTWGKDSTMSAGTLKLGSMASVELNVNLTVQNVSNEGAAFKIQDANRQTLGGNLIVNGTFSGGGTIPRLTMGNGATVKLSGAEQLKVDSFFACGTALTIDLSDYLALDQAPVVLPTEMPEDQMTDLLAKIAVIPPTNRPNTSLVVSGTSLALTYDPMELYWADWRGTFWEHIGQADVNGNHGLMRDADGNAVVHRPGDTVVFDKDHYTAGGAFADQTDYWHYDENLYITDEVQPGASNNWDLKVLQGVTLKMGLRGARATGQNVISKLKIFVDADSSLEFGYWGNTHHYQGVIRDGVVFGGAGMIVFGEDLGPSLKAEGNILVNGDETPVMNLNGKELVLAGTNAEIDVALTGFGSITPTAAGIHLMGNVNFGNAATIDASNAANMLTIDKSATFGANLTVKLTTAPAEGQSALVLALGENATLALQTTDVRVLVDGKPVAAFYELFQNDDDGNLYVRVKETPVVYTTSVSEGYDFAGGLVTVTMDPAIADLPVTVAIKNDKGVTVRKDGEDWTGAMVVGPQGAGSATVMAGDEDHLLAAGKYSYTVTVGEKSYEGSFFVGNTWFAADAASGASDVFNGAWQTAPLIADHHYQISGEATFDVASDKAAGELGVVEHAVRFTSAADVETLEDFEDLQANAIGAITLAEGVASEQSEEPGVRWVGSVNGEWVELAGVAATQGDHVIRMEFDRSGETAKMRYLVDGVALTATATDAGGWFELCRGESSVAAAEATFSSVSYVGAGGLERLTGFVDDLSLAEYNGVKYQTMAEAVAAWTANGKTGAITLLTNVYFAPEPGTYEIAKNGFKLYMTNDMKILSESGTTVVIGFPIVVEGLTTAEDGYPVVIAGEWLGHAIPWKTKKDVRRELWNKPEGSDFTWWQSYVLGIAADKAATAKTPFAFAAASDDPNTVTFDDGLSPKNERETGVVVTRKLIGGSMLGLEEAVEATYDELRRPIFDLRTMPGRVQYLRLQYDFKADLGQELP